MEIKCPMCGGTEFDTEERWLVGPRKVKYCRPEFFAYLRGSDIQPRVCLNCGFVAIFLKPD